MNLATRAGIIDTHVRHLVGVRLEAEFPKGIPPGRVYSAAQFTFGVAEAFLAQAAAEAATAALEPAFPKGTVPVDSPCASLERRKQGRTLLYPVGSRCLGCGRGREPRGSGLEFWSHGRCQRCHRQTRRACA